MTDEKFCYWCHELLPPLPDDATYVDEINHCIHDDCRDARDELNRRRDELEARVAEGSDDLPEHIRTAILDLLAARGFEQRCPCLYDPEHGFRGYGTHRHDCEDETEDYDEVNAVSGCPLCGGTGTHDPLPDLLATTDDDAAARWVEEHIQRGAGPCDHWRGFPETGWYYNALSYSRSSKTKPRGVTVFNYDLMLGGTITYGEIAERFRPRVQASLF